jgi:hypothetical protein
MVQVTNLSESMLIAETASLVGATAAEATSGRAAGVMLTAPATRRVASRAATRLRRVVDGWAAVVWAGMAGSFRSIGAA